MPLPPPPAPNPPAPPSISPSLPRSQPPRLPVLPHGTTTFMAKRPLPRRPLRKGELPKLPPDWGVQSPPNPAGSCYARAENCVIGIMNDNWTNWCLPLIVCTLPTTLGFTSASTRPSTTPRECFSRPYPIWPTHYGKNTNHRFLVFAVVSRSTVKSVPAATP